MTKHSYMKLLFYLIPIVMFISCGDRPTSAKRDRKEDSTEIVRLLKEVYRWHDKSQDTLSDFSIIVKDSFQVGVSYDSLDRTISALKQTGYFSSTFMANFKRLADIVNIKLTSANPKLLNEINFGFQEADPWTGFQDSSPNYWEKMTISDFRDTADSASLSWKLTSSTSTSDPYAVGFLFENGKWRIAYLQGFDSKNY